LKLELQLNFLLGHFYMIEASVVPCQEVKEVEEQVLQPHVFELFHGLVLNFENAQSFLDLLRVDAKIFIVFEEKALKNRLNHRVTLDVLRDKQRTFRFLDLFLEHLGMLYSVVPQCRQLSLKLLSLIISGMVLIEDLVKIILGDVLFVLGLLPKFRLIVITEDLFLFVKF